MREQRQRTFKTYRCHSSAAVAWWDDGLWCGMLGKKRASQCRRAKSITISFSQWVNSPILSLISMLCESRYGWAEVGFWQVAQKSWECWVMKESLAHVLSYSVLERLRSEWSRDLACPILQSSLSQVSNRCSRRLAAPLFWLFPVNMTLAERCLWHCESLSVKK